MNLLSRWLSQAKPKNRAAARALSSLTSDLWLYDPERLEALFGMLRSLSDAMSAADIRAALNDPTPPRSLEMTLKEGVARIRIAGTLMREVPCMFDFFGIEATSSAQAKEAIQEATSDSRVEAIMLDIDSPGGTVDGIAALADAIFEARGTKPVHAYAQDLAASAAIWVATQAKRFTAGETSAIGSIGVYTVIDDVSAAFEEQGVTRHVVRFGEHKAAGFDGTEVTKEQLGEFQRRIDAIGQLFVSALARGRGMSREAAAELATGQVWTGVEAVAKGVIDAVESAEQALTTLKQSQSAKPTPRAPMRADSNVGTSAGTSEGSAMNLETILAKIDRGEKLTAEELAFLRETTGAKASTRIEERADLPPDVRASIAADREKSEALAKRVAELEEKESQAKYVAEAQQYPYVPGLSMDEIAAQLRAADEKLSKEQASKIRTSFAATNKALEHSKLFEAFGTSRSGDNSPIAQLRALASELRAKNPKLSQLEALDEAGASRPDLYEAAQAQS